MDEFRKVKLPSGATLKIGVAPFADSKNLYQALLRELRGVNVAGEIDFRTLWKDLFCIGFSSPDVDAAMSPCLARCLYDEQKITDATFEPVKCREDYLRVLMEVARDNVDPFAKQLFAEWLLQSSLQRAKSSPGS